MLGNYWGGGRGSYGARPLKNFKTKKALIKEATKMFNDGSLDSGMGFESLVVAVIEITKRTRIEVEGKYYYREDSELEFLGEGDEEAVDFLLDQINGG